MPIVLPTKIGFPEAEWAKIEGGGAVGRMKRHLTEDGEVIRILELDPKWNEKEWCRRKHVGYVLSGSLTLETATGARTVIRRGEGFLVPKGCPHKAGCRKTTRLFIID